MSETIKNICLCCCIIAFACVPWKTLHAQDSAPWVSDQGNGTYKNPILFSDYSDPDAIRAGDDFYMTSSSFQETPGLPILHSKDLVNWTIVGFAIDTLPSPLYALPQYGKGVWAPSIRQHNGDFLIYYGDPDFGIFVVTAKNPRGAWSSPHLVKAGKGLIDPCPLWDDDGKAYLVHGWAKSRAGFNSVLSVSRLSADGLTSIGNDSCVFDGHKTQPTIEGPKFYKRHGFYYIFAPAGGVKPGWQTVLRGKSPFGPYDERIVMDQGATSVNGPHQGAWVQTQTGEDWFLHFQDRNAYGRITHLEPLCWESDWPMIGSFEKGRTKGSPVPSFRKPDVGAVYPVAVPQTSDEFDSSALGFQWQWNANYRASWFSLTDRSGFLRLFAQHAPKNAYTLRDIPNILVQKIPAPVCTVTLRIEFPRLLKGEKFGFSVLGIEYSSLTVERADTVIRLYQTIGKEGSELSPERVEGLTTLRDSVLYLRIAIADSAMCRFYYSLDDDHFHEIGGTIKAREGRWIGARIGMVCVGVASPEQEKGYVDIDWIHFH